MTSAPDHLLRAVELSRLGVRAGDGGPFGCVVARDGEVIAEGWNRVIATSDPTAHAEIVAIRAACTELGAHQLTGCTIYASCEPCPMCLGAIYWARPAAVYYANTRAEAAAIGFDDSWMYGEVAAPVEARAIPFVRRPHPEAYAVMQEWAGDAGRATY